jgi:hypothetical protein
MQLESAPENLGTLFEPSNDFTCRLQIREWVACQDDEARFVPRRNSTDLALRKNRLRRDLAPEAQELPTSAHSGGVSVALSMVRLEPPNVNIARRQMLRLLGMGLPAALGYRSTRRLAAQGAAAVAKSKTVQVSGTTLHYLEWGREQAPPLVLLHPAPLNARVWDRFGPAMAPHFRVLGPDACGFGDTRTTPST